MVACLYDFQLCCACTSPQPTALTLCRDIVDDVFAHALKKQTGVALKYMLDFGANPIERQLILSAQVGASGGTRGPG